MQYSLKDTAARMTMRNAPPKDLPTLHMGRHRSEAWTRRGCAMLQPGMNAAEVVACIGICQYIAWHYASAAPQVLDICAAARVAFAYRHRIDPIPGVGAALYIDWMLYGGTV